VIEGEKFYDARVVGARWYEPEDGGEPTLNIRVEVDGERLTRYLDTSTPEKVERMKRELKALGVDESAIYTEQFFEDPFAVIGAQDCQIKTRVTQTGKVAVAYICDPQREAKPVSVDTKARLMARLRGGAPVPTPAPADDDLPF
jgi:hypothetical protein